MKKQKHYIIGDVHGMYEMLLLLLEKLPKDSIVIFVGDLIDRGEDSAKVIKLIRERKYQTVLGNHESTMLLYFKDYFSKMSIAETNKKWSSWLHKNGGKETLKSYQIWNTLQPSRVIIQKIKDDLAWIENLPIFIEIETTHKSKKPIVISHSNISKVWHLRKNPEDLALFKDTATRTRDLEHHIQSNIFNIYGHTITKEPTLSSTHVNVDIGAYKYGMLIAYCVEDDLFTC
jgi:serine/threonine protein phosphatase 1